MPDEQELQLNPDPIVGVQGPTTPPISSGRQSPGSQEQRRRNRFAGAGANESRRGGFGFQEKPSKEGEPSAQEESGEPAASVPDQAVAEQAIPTEAPRREASQPQGLRRDLEHGPLGSRQAETPRTDQPNEGHVRQPPKKRFGAGNQVNTYIANQEQARSFAQDIDNLSGAQAFTSMPNLCKASLKAFRAWHHVPDSVTDDSLQAGVDPAMLALILQIVQQVLACLPNSKDMAWGRVVNYSNAKPMERLGDNLRLNGMIKEWMTALAIPREAGDVMMVREAVVQTAASLKPEEFAQIQTEVNFLTI